MDLDAFRYYTGWNDHANRERYDAPADPWAPIHVDPTGVERFSVVELTWGLGRVRGGDWDRPAESRRLDDTRLYEGLVERFEDGTEWTETAYYDRAAERFDEGTNLRGFETLAAYVEKRCSALDDLYETLRDEGYRPNYEAVYDDPEDLEYVHEMEPMVLVGRSGEVIWTEGFHRLILARLAGIDAVPVYVLRRHEGWQRTRDAAHAAEGDLPADVEVDADHPDLRDVVDRG